MYFNEFNQEKNDIFNDDSALNDIKFNPGIVFDGKLLSDESTIKLKKLISSYIDIPNNLIESMFSFINIVEESNCLSEKNIFVIRTLINDVNDVLDNYTDLKNKDVNELAPSISDGEIDKLENDRAEKIFSYWEEISEKTERLRNKVVSILNSIKEKKTYSPEDNLFLRASLMFNTFADIYTKIFLCDLKNAKPYNFSNLVKLSGLIDSNNIIPNEFYTKIPFVVVKSSLQEIFQIMESEIEDVFKEYTKNFSLNEFLATIEDDEFQYSTLKYIIQSDESIFKEKDSLVNENGCIEIRYNCPPALYNSLLNRIDFIKSKFKSTSNLLEELGSKLEVEMKDSDENYKLVITLNLPEEKKHIIEDHKLEIFSEVVNDEDFFKVIPFKFKDLDLYISSNIFDEKTRRKELAKDIKYIYENLLKNRFLKSCGILSSEDHDEIILSFFDKNTQGQIGMSPSGILFPRDILKDKIFFTKIKSFTQNFENYSFEFVCSTESKESIYDQVHNQLNFIIENGDLILSELDKKQADGRKLNIFFENINEEISSLTITDNNGRCYLFEDYYI